MKTFYLAAAMLLTAVAGWGQSSLLIVIDSNHPAASDRRALTDIKCKDSLDFHGHQVKINKIFPEECAAENQPFGMQVYAVPKPAPKPSEIKPIGIRFEKMWTVVLAAPNITNDEAVLVECWNAHNEILPLDAKPLPNEREGTLTLEFMQPRSGHCVLYRGPKPDPLSQCHIERPADVPAAPAERGRSPKCCNPIISEE